MHWEEVLLVFCFKRVQVVLQLWGAVTAREVNVPDAFVGHSAAILL